MDDRVADTGDRYVLHREIASGAMGTIHLGRMKGAAGFSRVVAIKRMHQESLGNAELVAMFADEARTASRVVHPNVVAALDVVLTEREVLVVMEYVHGRSLLDLLRAAVTRGERVPAAIAAAIVIDVLYGLHAAHEAKGRDGSPLELIHRDVSPGNVLVGVDGVSRITDFGVAKARGRSAATQDGSIKGKLAYMPPEQLYGHAIDRRVDVYAAGVLFWEALAGRELFAGDTDDSTIERALTARVPPPSELDPAYSAFDPVVARALSRDVSARFATARDMAVALAEVCPRATAVEVGEWVQSLAGPELVAAEGALRAIEAQGAGAQAGAESVRTKTPSRRFARSAIGGVLVVAGALALTGAVARKDRAPSPVTEAVAPAPLESAEVNRAAPPSPPPIVPDALSATQMSRVPVSAPRRMQAKKARPPSVDCQMPFTVDAEGHKHFRPECAP